MWILSLVNGNHALIAANGYTLTLDNVTYFQNTREVHIVGGTLYDKKWCEPESDGRRKKQDSFKR